MDFDAFASQTKGSQKDYQKEIENEFSDRGIGEDRMKEIVQELCGLKELPKLDAAEQARRRNASQKMQEKMKTWLFDNFEMSQHEKFPNVYLQAGRHLSSDFLLQLPHPEQAAEYDRRAKILLNGTPEEKTDLFFDVLHQAQQGVTREKLKNLTDEEIAEDFDRLFLLYDVMYNAKVLTQNSQLKMSPEQKQEMLNLRQELMGPLSTIITKAELISQPSYAYIPYEQLPYLDSLSLTEKQGSMEKSDHLTDDEKKVIPSIKRDLSRFNDNGIRQSMIMDIAGMELDGAEVTDVTWLKESGRTIGKKDYVPEEELVEGRALIAQLPNGTEKIFTMERGKDGILTCATYDPISYWNKFLSNDEQMKKTMSDLTMGLEKADPWYINSSREFKNVQKNLETLQKEWKKLGPNPTEYQLNTMSQKVEALQKAASAYINKKLDNGEKSREDLNDRERQRVEAVEAVRDFAGKHVHFMKAASEELKQKKEMNSPEKEAFGKAAMEAGRAQNQEKISEQDRQAREFQHSETFRENMPKTPYHKRVVESGWIRHISCENSLECGDAFQKLRLDADASLGKLAGIADQKTIPEKQQASVKEHMAKVTLVHLILEERGANFTENSHAGPIEKALKENPKALVNSVMKEPQFNQGLGKVTPERVDEFIMKGGARKLSQALIQKGVELAKAQKSAPSQQKQIQPKQIQPKSLAPKK